LGALLLLGIVGLIVGQQRARNPLAASSQATVIKVDTSRAEGDRLAANLRTLSREMEEFTRRQAEHTEAAKSKAQSQAAAKPPASPSPGQSVEASAGKVDCRGEGRAFSVTHQDDGVSISYNGGPRLRPTVNDQGLGMVVVSKVEPTNRVSIAFMKGDKDRTIVLINDAAGNLFKTFGVECTAAAF
jgi:hypothetical protein